MNTSTLRRKRVILPAVATIAVLAIGGTVWAASADDVTGDERDRVAAAATQAAGGGEATEVETSDDAGEAYEVEVRLADGSEVDVTLDQDLNVLGKDADDHDDRVLSATERASAEKAALAAVGGGTVQDVEASDDRGAAYEVEVLDQDNLAWDVDLDADFEVLNKFADN